MNNTLDEKQIIAVQALEELKRICDKHQIKFYLLAGSTLGAVRHQGMIPWDDDIDVGFLYDDWIKIKKILPDELSSNYEFADYDVKPGFPRMFAKILHDGYGCVDLFLIAKWTSNRISARVHWQLSHWAYDLYKYSIKYKSVKGVRYKKLSKRVKFRRGLMDVLKRIVYGCTVLFCGSKGYINLAKWNERYYEKNVNTDYYINLYSVYSMKKEMIKAEWIHNTSTISFEGNDYFTVGDVDAYLKHLYGDYMKLPPEEERVKIHSERFE